MDGRFLILLPIAFAAGIVTAVSPCVFPVLPILFAGGASGGRRRPYAIIAGLVTSFALELLVYPAVYAIWKWRFVMKHGTVDVAKLDMPRLGGHS